MPTLPLPIDRPALDPIAVLIPVYRDQGGLDITLASLTVPPGSWVVVVDDASPAPVVLPPNLPYPVTLIRQTQNTGITGALNTGLLAILESDAVYVARIDAGDTARPERLDRQREYLRQHPRTAVVGSWLMAGAAGNTQRYLIRYPETPAEVRRELHLRNCIAHPAAMIRTDVFRELGLYADGFPAAEDYELFFRVAQRYDLANIPEPLTSYHFSVSGISSQRRRRQIGSTLAVQRRYFRRTDFRSYLGLVRTVGHYLLPYRALVGIKTKFWRATPAPTSTPAPNAPRLAPSVPGSTPLISIVLPTYNRASLLEAVVTNIQRQTLTDWELIVVDDGSPDETWDVLQRIAEREPRVRPIRHSHNQRLPAALNTGFREAKGQFLTWTSDDNAYDADALETLWQSLVDQPEAGLVYAGYRVVDTAGLPCKVVRARPPQQLVVRNVVGACFMYRRAVWEVVGSYAEDLFLSEDYDYWLRTAAHFGLAPVNRELYAYTLTPGSLRERRVEVMEATVRALERNLAAVPFAVGPYRRLAALNLFRLEFRLGRWPNAVRRLLSVLGGTL